MSPRRSSPSRRPSLRQTSRRQTPPRQANQQTSRRQRPRRQANRQTRRRQRPRRQANRPRRTRAPDRRAVAPPPDINRHQPVASPDGSTPIFIGLTGAVAAGKSEALAAFSRLGAATLSSDAIVHALLDSPEVRERLV